MALRSALRSALRFTHLLGAFLLFISTVLLIITDITAPAASNLAIFRVHINSENPSGNVYYGTFGYCIDGQNNECTSSAVGYSPSQALLRIGLVSSPLSDAEKIEGYTKAMVLHPIATCLNFIAFLLAVRQGVMLSLSAFLVALLAVILTLVAMAVDLTWFNMLRDDLSPVDVSLSTGFGTLAAAFACSLLGAIIVLFTCCTARRRRKAHKPQGVETTITTTTTTTVPKGADPHVHHHGHTAKHKRHRRCFCSTMATVQSVSQIIYQGPKDWDRFKGEFQSRAYALDIWDFIDPDQLPSDSTLEDVDLTGYPTNVLEMTTEGKQAYNQEFTAYIYKDRKYDTFRKGINDLTKWVLEFVSPAIKGTSFLPGKNLREWYAKLAESGKVYDGRLLINT
ncbi:hypothetical protein DL764_010024 [Monosporascus ibericus]|uniref:Uncharacterized protein n=1 Tax=Monosporascus ibericus TaxID=155417 RepID=A0A4Q4STH9_9PEZI|nr:hypothetical protein DL764_010024 [Monosporascus ibericus]